MKRFFLTLYPMVVIATIIGFLLGFIYQSLEGKILESKKREERLVLEKIFPSAKDFIQKKLEDTPYYEVLNEANEVVGYVFKTGNVGYGGVVEAMIGITNNVVSKVVIISADNETPGLGSKVTHEEWLAQFAGKSYSQIPATKMEFKDKGVDAVSGATYSSLAVAKDIIKAFQLYSSISNISIETVSTSSPITNENTNGGIRNER